MNTQNKAPVVFHRSLPSWCLALLAAVAILEDAESAVLSWALSNGAKLASGVELRQVQVGGRGLVSVGRLPEGAELLRIPRRLLLTVDTEPSTTLRPAALLTVRLLREAAKQEASFFHAYLRALPRAYTDGGGFSSDECAALQAPHAVAEVTALRCERQADYRAAVALLAPLPERFRSSAAWTWAASTVATRTVSLGPGDTAGALCPLGDMVNHAYALDGGAGYGAYHSETDTYRFYTIGALAAGEQAFVSYGAYAELELLAHYGFLLGSSNTADCARIPRTAHFNPPVADDQLLLSCIGRPTWALLSTLRLSCVSPQLRRSHGHLAAAGLAINASSEAEVQQRLSRACRAALAALPTSRLDDEALLRTIPIGSRMALAVSWRASYKRILERAAGQKTLDA